MSVTMAELGDSAHVVQFYSEDDALIDVVSRLVGTALVTGESALVLATRSHERQLRKRLQGRGFDVTVALGQGRYAAVECSDVLRRITRNGSVDRSEFKKTLTTLIVRARASAEGNRVVVFGELVGVLASDGNVGAALQLETLWNELSQDVLFALCCGYPMDGFRGERATAPFLQICGQHSHVFPAERRSRRHLAERQAYTADQQRRAQRYANEVTSGHRLFDEATDR